MLIEEIVKALQEYDFNCENCGVREECNKGYSCIMDDISEELKLKFLIKCQNNIDK